MYQVKLAGSAADKNASLEIASNTNHRGVIAVYNTNGTLVQKQQIFIPSGVHRFPVSKTAGHTNKAFLVVLYIDNQLVYTTKLFDF